jgi:hypothetical protein
MLVVADDVTISGWHWQQWAAKHLHFGGGDVLLRGMAGVHLVRQ